MKTTRSDSSYVAVDSDMESFLEGHPQLSGYLMEMPAANIHKSWEPFLEEKVPLEFKCPKLLWTLRMSCMDGSPVFCIELGFRKRDNPIWRSFPTVVVLDLHVLPEALLINVVNSTNYALGVIIMKAVDRMEFCKGRLMHNFHSVPTMYQELMLDVQASCEASSGNFHQSALIVSSYVARANAMHTSRLNDRGMQDSSGMDPQGKPSKKNKTAELSSGAAIKANICQQRRSPVRQSHIVLPQHRQTGKFELAVVKKGQLLSQAHRWKRPPSNPPLVLSQVRGLKL